MSELEGSDKFDSNDRHETDGDNEEDVSSKDTFCGISSVDLADEEEIAHTDLHVCFDGG